MYFAVDECCIRRTPPRHALVATAAVVGLLSFISSTENFEKTSGELPAEFQCMSHFPRWQKTSLLFDVGDLLGQHTCFGTANSAIASSADFAYTCRKYCPRNAGKL